MNRNQTCNAVILGLILDGGLAATIGVVCWLSIVHQFTNNPTFRQIGQSKPLSWGLNHSNAVYCFQLTLWHLWISVVGYVVIYNMIYKRLLQLWHGKPPQITSLERVLDRVAVTLAFTVFMVYWTCMSPFNMASYTTAFDLVNTMGCHIVAPLISIAYFYFKYKRIGNSNAEENEANPQSVKKSKIDSFINELNEGKLWYWFFVFFIGIAVFGGLSAVSQRWVTSTPVYYVGPDWHNRIEVIKSIVFCAGLLFFTLFNLHTMQSRGIFFVILKVLIFWAIFTTMPLTLFYGFAVQCAGLNWGSLEPLILVVSFGVGPFISLIIVGEVLPKVEEYIFPKFFNSSSVTTESTSFSGLFGFSLLGIVGVVGVPIEGYLSLGGLSMKAAIIKAVMGAVFGIAIMTIAHFYKKLINTDNLKKSKIKWGLLLFFAGELVGVFGGIAIRDISKSGSFGSLLINHTMLESTIIGTLIGLVIIAIVALYNNFFRGVNHELPESNAPVLT